MRIGHDKSADTEFSWPNRDDSKSLASWASIWVSAGNPELLPSCGLNELWACAFAQWKLWWTCKFFKKISASTSSVSLRFLTQELTPLRCVLENSIKLLKWVCWCSWVTGAKCFSLSTWFWKCSLPRLNQNITKVPTVIFKIHVHRCVCRAFFVYSTLI